MDEARSGLDDRLKQLIETGKRRGWVSYAEVLGLLPPDWETGRQIDSILAKLDCANIELREGPESNDEARAWPSSDDEDDPVSVYEREIGTVLPLAPGEEGVLAKYLAQAGQRAFAEKRLVEANLPTVLSLARFHAASGASLLDLIAEGNIGLMKAADTFDAACGGKFSTFAKWWARHAIVRAASRK
jgi:RNA polymerase primary sigma factor